MQTSKNREGLLQLIRKGQVESRPSLFFPRSKWQQTLRTISNHMVATLVTLPVINFTDVHAALNQAEFGAATATHWLKKPRASLISITKANTHFETPIEVPPSVPPTPPPPPTRAREALLLPTSLAPLLEEIGA